LFEGEVLVEFDGGELNVFDGDEFEGTIIFG
jgi:hypothetical protein